MGLVDYDFTAIRKELVLHDLQLLYLQSELKKLGEELDDLQRKQDALRCKWDELKHEYQKLCDFLDRITSPEFIKRIEDPDLKKKIKKLARDWKKIRETSLLKQS